MMSSRPCLRSAPRSSRGDLDAGAHEPVEMVEVGLYILMLRGEIDVQDESVS